MISAGLFTKGITHLKNIYANWNFDLKNKDMLSAWYDMFKNLDEETYRFIIKEYINTCEYAPQSPLSLLKLLDNYYTQKELPPNEIWNKVLGLVRSYGFKYGRTNIYKELQAYPVLTQTVKQYESELSNLMVGDTHTRKNFENAYSDNLKAYAKQQKEKTLEIGTSKNDTKLLSA